jgi:hypothetical protein
MESKKQLQDGYEPYEIMWRRGSCLCATNEALKNIEIELEEAAIMAYGGCPRCRRKGGHAPDCSLRRAKP